MGQMVEQFEKNVKVTDKKMITLMIYVLTKALVNNMSTKKCTLSLLNEKRLKNFKKVVQKQ